MYNIALFIFIFSSVVILYHHVFYPVILNLIAKRKQTFISKYYLRNYRYSNEDNKLPNIQIIMPACNEEKYIKEKIINLASLDYPEAKVKITVILDGCSDNTEIYAKEIITNMNLKNFNLIINKANKGKIHSLNSAISVATEDIIVLTDASSIISIDSLLVITSRLANEKIGAVSSKYCFLKSSVGEKVYWNYQSKIKIKESNLGSTLGAHGACYAFKRKLFNLIPQDIINDDFWLPAQIILQGYSCVHDDRIIALELESASNNMDFKRRIRISLGNIQQAFRCAGLLKSKYKIVVFAFFSGKFIRAFMPIFLLLALFSALILAGEYLLFKIISIIAVSLLVYSSFCLLFNKEPKSKKIKLIHYIICSYIAITLGLFNYLLFSSNNSWKKIN